MVKTSGKKRSAKELEAEAEAEAETKQKLAAGPDPNGDDDGDVGGDGDSSSSSDEEDDDLVLEGEVIRPAGMDSSDEELSSEEEDNDAGGMKPREIPLPEDYVESKKKKTTNKSDATRKNEEKKSKSKNEQKKGKGGKGKSKSAEPTVNKVDVDFIFCDMDEKFFFGIKTLLLSNPTLAPQSSPLADLIIENVSVGTVISAEGYTDGDDDVFGYASVLNVTTNESRPCIQYLKKQCLDHCPVQHREELETVLSGKTKRPAGFLIHGRYVSSNPNLL